MPRGTEPPQSRGLAGGDSRRTPSDRWIGNSRNSADEDVVRLLGGMAGFEPRVAHQCDSLELVQDMIVAGYGVGMLPTDCEVGPASSSSRSRDPEVVLRAYAQTRRGRRRGRRWRLLLDRIIADREVPSDEGRRRRGGGRSSPSWP